ncbi:efflux RND transporter periplasmic adaptor subunit [Patescibacteria group bacterium]|nr:efflux RND transporter periplasmic adaptor subunit [Patescibacteria group bacterium]MBU1721500.1 efflux RND transporter periplasmic adaptor subunit [Patescibacteria group bacterium]MBU1900928.1 efflux RND transporter periplasmic adaptor subunit [Patescibacteria group bacterium]
MKRIAIIIISILLLLAVGYVAYTYYIQSSDEITPVVEETPILHLQPEQVSSTIQITGILEPYRETVVSAKVGGRIAEMQAAIGDTVLQATLLASLAGDESSVQLDNAVTNEQNIQSFYQSQRVFLNEQVAAAEQAVQTAQMAVQLSTDTERQGGTTLDEKQLSVSSTLAEAESALAQVQAIAQRRVDSVYSSAKSTLRAGLMAMSSGVDYADTVLGISPGKNIINNEYDELLGVLNSSSVTSAKDTTRRALIFHDEYEQLYDEIVAREAAGDNISHEEWDEYLASAVKYLDATQDALKDLYTMFQHTAAIGNVTASMLENFKTQNMIVATQVEGALFSVQDGIKMGVRGLLVTLDDIAIQNQAEISTAERRVATVMQSQVESSAYVNQMQQQQTNQRHIAETQLAQAEAAFRAAQAQRDAALRDIESTIDMVRGNKRLSQVAVYNTQIGAPYAGVITEKFMEVGQVVAPGQAVFKIMDTSLLKVVSVVPDIYANDVYVGMPAHVEIDGVDGTYVASVSKVYPRVDAQTRTLKIELTLHEKPEQFIVGGFSRITLQGIAEVQCHVPRSALKSNTDGLFLVEQESNEFIPVQILLEDAEHVFIACPEHIQTKTFHY